MLGHQTEITRSLQGTEINAHGRRVLLKVPIICACLYSRSSSIVDSMDLDLTSYISYLQHTSLLNQRDLSDLDDMVFSVVTGDMTINFLRIDMRYGEPPI